MSTKALDIERWILELLIVLKQESEAMAQVKQWLEQLREGVMQHDELGLESLLKDIQTQQGLMPRLEERRQQIRMELARILEVSFEQVTLTGLLCLLEGELHHQVTRMRDLLQSQAESLRVQHRGTAMLLADCARFNRLLLNSIFETSHAQVTTYTARGHAEQKRSSDLVNLQF